MAAAHAAVARLGQSSLASSLPTLVWSSGQTGMSIGVEKGPPIGMEKGRLLIIGSGSSPESIGGTRA
jgi:hypothetical protein